MFIIQQHPNQVPGIIRDIRLGLRHQVLGLQVNYAVLITVNIVISLDLISFDEKIRVVFRLKQPLVIEELFYIRTQCDQKLLVEIVDRTVLFGLEFLNEVVVDVA